jgi:hypothetical protein
MGKTCRWDAFYKRRNTFNAFEACLVNILEPAYNYMLVIHGINKTIEALYIDKP